ncbi:MAG TPA: hypothetical protein ENF73_02465 [Proteobacteria bacterium]|nr:hypothetical protein [Pseudomonadota bacterium]
MSNGSRVEIGLQFEFDIPDELPSVERVYFGNRFCYTRFLEKKAEIPKLAERIRASGAKAILCIPHGLREAYYDEVVSAVEGSLAALDGVMASDLGVCRAFRDRTEVTYFGPVLNLRSAEVIIERAAHRLRPFPTLVDLLGEIGRAGRLEVLVHGRFPFGFSPRCQTRHRLGCERCGTPLPVSSKLYRFEVRGNAYYTAWLLCGYDIRDRLSPDGVETWLIEAEGIGQGELARLVGAYRGELPLEVDPEVCSNGLYFTKPDGSFRPWMMYFSGP